MERSNEINYGYSDEVPRDLAEQAAANAISDPEFMASLDLADEDLEAGRARDIEDIIEELPETRGEV